MTNPVPAKDYHRSKIENPSWILTLLDKVSPLEEPIFFTANLMVNNDEFMATK